MNYDEYVAACQKGSDLADAGDKDGAIAAFKALLDTDLPDMDKSVMCVNLATLSAQKGDLNACLAWYDQGIAYESLHGRFAITDMKAQFLGANGRKDEARALYQALLKRRDLNLNDRTRLGILLGRLDA